MLVLWLCALISCEALGRAVFDTFGTEQGLSQATVHCVLQDARGYLWFGTDDGLNRYDGTRFVQYRSDPADRNSLWNNGVWSLAEDADGNIWVGTQKGGLDRFERSTGLFETMLPDSVRRDVGGDAIVCIHVDEANRVWAGTTKSGLLVIDAARKNVRRLSVTQNGLPSDRIRCIAQDKPDELLVGTSNGGLFSFTTGTLKSTPLHEAEQTSAALGNVQSIVAVQDTLWIATLNAGVKRIVRSRRSPDIVESVESIPALSGKPTRAVQLDRKGRLWIATASEGLVEYDTRTAEVTWHKQSKTDGAGLSEDNLLCLAIDKSDDLWLGTWSTGANRLRLRETPFHAYEIGATDSTKTDQQLAVLALAQMPDGEVLAGTVGHGVHALSGGAYLDELRDATVTGLHYDATGRALVATYQSGVHVFDAQTGTLAPLVLPAPLDTLKIASVLAMLYDSRQRWWLGTVNQGLICWDSGADTAAHYKKANSEARRISDDIVYALDEDARGNIWVGTLDGLDCIAANGERSASYLYDRDDPNSLPNNEIRGIGDAPDGTLWVGTSNGLCAVSPDQTQFTRYTESAGLANGVIYGLLVDELGNAWMSTNRGISVVRKSTGSVENYFTWDGLPKGEFNQGACLRLASGEFLFGGSQAVVRFRPEEVNARKIPVVVTAVRDYQTNEYLAREPEAGTELVLPHARRHLVIDYSAIEFYGGVQRGYEYRMSGVTEQWIRNVPENSAVFTNLAPGQYRFAVKREGAADSVTTAIDITIRAPWWLRTEAVVVWFATGLAAIVFAFTFVQRRERKRALAKKEKELQVALNRHYLLDLLSIFGHSQTSKERLDGMLRNCRRLSDPEDTGAADRLTREASEFMAHAGDKLDDILERVSMADMPAALAGEFESRARKLEEYSQSAAQSLARDDLAQLAPRLQTAIDEFQQSLRKLMGELGRLYRMNLGESVARVVASKRVELDRAGVRRSVECPSDLICFFDAKEFETMLDDLIANAIEAMTGSVHRELRLTVIKTAPKIELLVQDSGLGIPKAAHGMVFKRSYSNKPSGTGGLGLYNARRTMHRYQGLINIQESEPGRGTIFRLTLQPVGAAGE